MNSFASGLLSCSREYVLCEIISCSSLKRPSPNLNTDVLQNYIRIYYQHGGSLFAGRFPEKGIKSSALVKLSLSCGLGIWNWFSESLLHSAESWTVDELSSFQICLLGTIAQVNSGFRTRLKAYLSSYCSPLLAARAIYADNLLESTFGIASVLSHFHKLDRWSSADIVNLLCMIGTPSILRLFIDAGPNLNAYEVGNNLGNAAAVGNLEIVRMFMENGVNTALGLTQFIYASDELSDGLYKHLLELLVENARPTSLKSGYPDALSAVMKSARALLTHPKAPEILFRQKVFSEELIKCSCETYLHRNYMCVAITKGLGSMVELLLQQGAYANTTSTWFLVSVECGAASCTETLIQHGADVKTLDKAGRSALQRARSNVDAPHPRFSRRCRGFKGGREITAKEDEETLAVVERAFRLKPQSTEKLTAHGSSCELEPQSLNQKDEGVLAPQNIFERVLGSSLIYHRRPILGLHSRCLYCEISDLWSLSFRKALLMRFLYVVSYILLLALEIIAFVQGRKRIRMPSRTLLSAVALLLLAFIWGPSLQTGLPWKPDTSRPFTKQDS